MADIQLNSVTLATESSGTVSLDNAVQDNITRLGTVTTGNLSNTAIVYRQGHILQAQICEWHATSATIVDGNSTYPFTTDLEISITCASTSNKLLISLYIPDVYNQTMNATGMHVGFHYSTDNWSTGINIVSDGNDQTKIAPYFGYMNNTNAVIEHLIVGPHGATVPTTTAMKIRPYMIGGGVGFKCNDNHSQGDVNTLTVMEVQG